MNITFLYYIFLVQIALFSAIQAKETRAKQLWKTQMKRLDELVLENNQAKPESPERQISPSFFGIEFDEEIRTETTIHTLRPRDVDVVAAMGDSITAANGAGAETAAGLAIEYVGICYSIGGDDELEQSITLPNILKKFNPRLTGYSVGNGPSLNRYPYGFNVGIPGARAKDMLGQAETLIELLKTDNRSKYYDDWKVMSLFIGGNDLCAIGRDPDGTTPEVYVAEIKKALDLLHQEVPRMFINLVDILDVYLLPYIGYGYGATPTCRALQQSFCGHVVDTMDNEEAQQTLKNINKEYQDQLQALIDTGIYDTRDDFTVIVQPFLRNTVLPYTEYGEVDATYFAPDCFHFSDLGHAAGALNLWNNMLEPVGKKTTEWGITNMKVPTEQYPYFFTYKNNAPVFEPSVEPETDEGTVVPVWVIVVISILVVVLAGEAFVLACLLGKYKDRKGKKHEAHELHGHDNENLEKM